MKPTAVLVETNWVVDIVAPAHFQNQEAVQLLQRAQESEFELHVPAICLAEARETIPRRFTPRSRSEDLRKFVRWARTEGRVTSEDAKAAFRVFEQFDGLVANELTMVAERLNNLAQHPILKVFALSEPMLERQVFIGGLDLSLKPYDLAVLAAVLVKAEELYQKGHSWVGFCELDADLQPWDKSGARKSVLSNLYNDAHMWVYPDFALNDVTKLPNAWTSPT